MLASFRNEGNALISWSRGLQSYLCWSCALYSPLPSRTLTNPHEPCRKLWENPRNPTETQWNLRLYYKRLGFLGGNSEECVCAVFSRVIAFSSSSFHSYSHSSEFLLVFRGVWTHPTLVGQDVNQLFIANNR